MKKAIILILSLMSFCASATYSPGRDKSPQAVYIEQFSTLAVEEMYRSGIPASITLAQGLLESRYGLSELAVKGNNHFGIKCHNNWKGGKMYHDDDRKGECFRKYTSPEQSYRDHSDFLRYRERYKFLFDYKITDYKSWAYGLKKAGYATDPSYPKKLIQLIEDYRLYEYDTKSLSFAASHKKSAAPVKTPKVEKKAAYSLPPSPSQIETVSVLSEEQRQDFHFNMSREVLSINGVPFVYSVDGDTYESLADSYGLFVRELLRINDMDSERPLHPGTVVFLQKKKKQAVKGLEKHVIEAGESMRDISQRYGIKLNALYKLNDMTEVDVPREGDIIRLRK